MKKYKEPALYALSLIIIILMHTVLLDQIPRGLNVDELGSAFDAYSLGKFGVDRWMKSWPVYFINYGDGQNALYTYLLVPVFLLFGTSIYAIRSVIAASSLVMAIFGAKCIRLLYQNTRSEIAFLYLYAIMPVFTITLRFGLESHLMMSTAMTALYFLMKSIKKGDVFSYILFGIFSGIVLYTYAIAYLVMPLFILFSLVYLIIKKNAGFKNILCAAIPFILLALPLLVEQLINKYDLPEQHLGIFTLTKLNGYRISELMTDGFLKKILLGIRSTFLFDDLKYNSIPKFGNFYYISLPFIVIGLFYCCVMFFKSLKKNNEVSLYAFPLLYWASYTIISGFMSDAPGYVNITRMNGVLAALIIFIFIGIKSVIEYIKKERIKKYASILIGLCYSISFVFFVGFYFNSFDEYAYPYKWLFYTPYDEEMFAFLDDPDNGYTENDVFLPWNYMYYLWAVKPNPLELNMIQSTDGDRDIKEFGRYKMTESINFNSEYVIYKYGYTGENIDYFTNVLHFDVYETDNYYLFLDPLHNLSFYRDDSILGYADGDEIILKKSYISDVADGQALFYGWISIPDDFGNNIQVSMITENGQQSAEILADTSEDERIICFQFSITLDEYFNTDTRIFRVTGYDDNDNVTYAVEKDMTLSE